MPVTFEDKILSATEARQQFFKLLEEVREGQPITIHQPKHDDVTMVPRAFILGMINEMEALTERIASYELATDANAMDMIAGSESDIKIGRTITLAEAKRALEERRRKHGHR